MTASYAKPLHEFVSAFSAATGPDGVSDFAGFLRLLDGELGLTQDERNAIRVAGERRLQAEIWAEVTRRRAEGCFPHGLRQKQAIH